MTKKPICSALTSILFVLLLIVVASAQKANQVSKGQSCRGPVYSSQEVTRRARVTDLPSLSITEEARDHNIHGRVIVQGILCRTGRVTDIHVIESLPYGMTENALQAVRSIKFTPAEKNWHTVSQRMQFEFHINDDGIEPIAPADAAGRSIETLEIIGNRRLTKEQILAWVHSRPGNLFSYEQLAKDLNAIRASGYFDKSQTRASVEKGARGGIVVIFRVVELPLISEVKFENLKQVNPSLILDALVKEGVDLRKGMPYRVGESNNATRIIKQMLESKGQRNPKIELRIQNLTATTVVLIFIVHDE